MRPHGLSAGRADRRVPLINPSSSFAATSRTMRSRSAASSAITLGLASSLLNRVQTAEWKRQARRRLVGPVGIEPTTNGL